jgi:hypothetical protein
MAYSSKEFPSIDRALCVILRNFKRRFKRNIQSV